MKQNCLTKLISDGVHRIKACHRVLENDTDLITADALYRILGCTYKIFAFIYHAAADNTSGVREYLHDRICCNTLSTAGFTNNAKHLAAVKTERNTVYSPYLTCGGKECGL